MVKWHIEIARIKEQLFSDEAVLAIHQGSGGLLRKANNLAKGSLIAAAKEKTQVVSAEHVRIASTEIISMNELSGIDCYDRQRVTIPSVLLHIY